MSGNRVLITGGTGFLGQHLVRKLTESGHTVRLLIRPSANLSSLAGMTYEISEGDVTNWDSVLRAMSGCRFVIHAAGLFRFWGQPQDFDHINVDGTFNVAEAAQAAQVERLVHISTIVVVGDPKPGSVITETTPCQPQDAYQRSKLAAEHGILSRAAAGGLPAIILRPGAYYGPGSRYGFNRLFVEEPMRGWRVKVEGGRRLTFSAYVPDVAEVAQSALTLGRAGEIYNVCDRSISHNTVNGMVSRLLGIPAWRFPAPRRLMIFLAILMEASAKLSRREPFYPLNLRHYIFNDWDVNSDKARSELGFRPTPIEEGLKNTVAWYRARAT
ncbi:MAG: NAD-dependent epimerase/dehydratase family protein [Anaerolineae bacterium]|nr:MAG: NAD-dependent epimerase/dehydratase family protein [Anaerolineae bacterium]